MEYQADARGAAAAIESLSGASMDYKTLHQRVSALTSGSTGASKRVPLTHANVCASIPEICASMSLSPDDRCLSMWEQFHVGGLVDLLMAPLSVGGTVICGTKFDVELFFNLLESTRPSWFQAEGWWTITRRCMRNSRPVILK